MGEAKQVITIKKLRKAAVCLFVFIFLMTGLMLPISLFVEVLNAAGMSAIVISKIAAFEKSGYEWIEIYNRSNEVVDTAGWKFYEDGTNHSWELAQGSDLILNPGESAVITQDKDKFLENNFGYAGKIIDSSWGSLKEAGEEIGLKNSSLEIVENFTFVACPDGVLERVDLNADNYTENNWKEIKNVENEEIDEVKNPDVGINLPEITLGNQILEPNNDHNEGGSRNPQVEIIPNRPPVAIISNRDLEINVGEAVIFDGTKSYDEDSDRLDYSWDFGDGEEAEGAKIERAYTKWGKFSVILRVFDGEFTASDAIWVSALKKEYSKDIFIQSFLPNPVGSDLKDEWVEICSGETAEINLVGWILDDEDGGSKEYVVKDEIVLDPDDCLKFYRRETRIAINNDGDSVRIFNPNKELVNEIVFKEKALDGQIFQKNLGFLKEDAEPSEEVFAAEKVEKNDDKTPSYPNVFSQTIKSSDNAEFSELPFAVKTGDCKNLENEFIKVAGKIIELSGNVFFIDDGSGSVRIQILPKTKIDFSQIKKSSEIIVSGDISRTGVGVRIFPAKIEIK
ncbi:MAG: lamin tail domain-containing protein [bacterium]